MTFMNLNPEVEAVFREFRTCELSTLAKDSTPITWPTIPYYLAEKGRFIITTSIGLPQKAFNIRRNPMVSIFFSNPTGCGLLDPPAVLVQGQANAPEEILTSFQGVFADMMRVGFERQPAGKLYSSNPLLRAIFDWYYMRLIIYVSPRRIFWWDHGEFSQAPHQIEVNHVE